MTETLSKFCCQKKKCPDYRKRGPNNLTDVTSTAKTTMFGYHTAGPEKTDSSNEKIRRYLDCEHLSKRWFLH
jgi:hypothetical protein